MDKPQPRYPRHGVFRLTIGHFGWLALLFAGVGLAIAGGGLGPLLSGMALRNHGAVAYGEITALNESAHRCGHHTHALCSSYAVRYRFFHDAQLVEGEDSVSQGLFQRLTLHQEIPVHYVAGNPSQNELEPGGKLNNGAMSELFGLALLLGSGIAVLRNFKLAQQMVHLRSFGAARQAKVVALTQTDTKINGIALWRMEWRDEAETFGESRARWKSSLPELGAQITVYADPEGRLPAIWERDSGSR